MLPFTGTTVMVGLESVLVEEKADLVTPTATVDINIRQSPIWSDPEQMCSLLVEKGWRSEAEALLMTAPNQCREYVDVHAHVEMLWVSFDFICAHAKSAGPVLD